MRALEFSVIVFVLASGGECFLRMPPKSKFQNRAEKVQVLVHAKDPENRFPLEYELDFNLDGSDIHVHLRENPKIKTNVEVFAMKSGSLVRKYSKDKEESVFYQDADNGAIFVVQSNGSGGANMMGFLQKGNYHFVLQSDDDFSVGGVNVPFDVLKEPIKVTDFADVDDTVNGSTRLNRRKRATGEYAVELLIAVDYAVYMYWYEHSTAPTPEEKETEAIESIKQFYAFVINGVDAMYKNIQTSSYTISVLFSEIIIAQTPEDSPWTEDIKDTSFDPPRVDSSTALNNFRSWIQSQQNLPGHDHAMLFTRYDLVYQGSSANSGLAYTSTACSTSSQSIVEDSFNFVMLTIAAHELGHSLGAAHDGTGNVCSTDDGYIMAPSTGPRQDPSLATNAWEFSSCSTNYFTNYLDSIGSPNCLQVLDAAHNASALAQFEGQLPGQVYDADTQCRLIEGPDSYMCRHIYEGNFSTICTTLWCKNPDEWFSCTGSVAADGTVCGDQKWCISGVCTNDPQAQSGDESCLYGDMIGYLFAQYNWTCFDVINNAPQQCVEVPIKCCDTCESVLSTTTTTTPEIAQPITLQDADLQCEVANGPGSIFCRQAYHGTFELICYIGLVCTSPTDVLNCTHAIIPANGTLCGNQKWCLPGPYCGFDENAPTVEDERCLYGDVIGYTYNGWNCSDLVVNAPEYCDNNDVVKLRCCESCAQRITASTTLTLEPASTTLSPTTTLEQSTSTSITTTTTIQPSTTSPTTTTTIETSTTTSSTTPIEPSTTTSSTTTTIQPSTTTSSTTTTIQPSTTTSLTTTLELSTTMSSTTTTMQSSTTTSSTTTTIEPSTTTSSTTTTVEPSTTTSSTTTIIEPSTTMSSTTTTIQPSTTTSSTTTTVEPSTTTSSTTTIIEPSTTTSSTTTTMQSSTTTSSTTTNIEPLTTTSSTTTIEPSTTTSSTTTTIQPSTTTSSTTTTIEPSTTTLSTTTTIEPSTTTSSTTTTIQPSTTTSSTTTIEPSTTTSPTTTTIEPSTTTSSTTTTIQTSFTTYSTTTKQPTATLQPPMSTITTPPTFTVPKKKCHNRHNTYPGK